MTKKNSDHHLQLEETWKQNIQKYLLDLLLIEKVKILQKFKNFAK